MSGDTLGANAPNLARISLHNRLLNDPTRIAGTLLLLPHVHEARPSSKAEIRHAFRADPPLGGESRRGARLQEAEDSTGHSPNRYRSVKERQC
jgi:hypothetical protein